MTNPGNAIGTNGAYGGRTSVNAFNDVLSGFSLGQAGILSGWGVSINDSQQLVLGGGTQVRDVAIAMDPNGNFTSVDNISGQPIALTLPAAPATGTRYDMVVAYVVNPPMGTETVADNPGACGLIIVDGGTGGMEASDADTKIREAITQDGAAGTTAYYVVLCEVMRQAGETVISPGKISSGKDLGLGFKFPIKSQDIDFETFTQFNYSTNEQVAGKWIDGKPLYRKVLTGVTNSSGIAEINVLSLNIDTLVSANGFILSQYEQKWPIPNNFKPSEKNWTAVYITDPPGKLIIEAGTPNYASKPFHIIIEYTKSTD